MPEPSPTISGSDEMSVARMRDGRIGFLKDEGKPATIKDVLETENDACQAVMLSTSVDALVKCILSPTASIWDHVLRTFLLAVKESEVGISILRKRLHHAEYLKSRMRRKARQREKRKLLKRRRVPGKLILASSSDEESTDEDTEGSDDEAMKKKAIANASKNDDTAVAGKDDGELKKTTRDTLMGKDKLTLKLDPVLNPNRRLKTEDLRFLAGEVPILYYCDLGESSKLKLQKAFADEGMNFLETDDPMVAFIHFLGAENIDAENPIPYLPKTPPKENRSIVGASETSSNCLTRAGTTVQGTNLLKNCLYWFIAKADLNPKQGMKAKLFGNDVYIRGETTWPSKGDWVGMTLNSNGVFYPDGLVESSFQKLVLTRDGRKNELNQQITKLRNGFCAGNGPIQQAAEWVARVDPQRRMAFTGAGISAESGVPTYRDPGGLWEFYNPEEVSSIKGFGLDPRKVWAFEVQFYKLLEKVRFNPAHKAISDLECAVVTQNVDGLHQNAGSKDVIEVHGSEVRAICLQCKRTTPMDKVVNEIIGDVNIPKEFQIMNNMEKYIRDESAHNDISSDLRSSDGRMSSRAATFEGNEVDPIFRPENASVVSPSGGGLGFVAVSSEVFCGVQASPEQSDQGATASTTTGIHSAQGNNSTQGTTSPRETKATSFLNKVKNTITNAIRSSGSRKDAEIALPLTKENIKTMLESNTPPTDGKKKGSRSPKSPKVVAKAVESDSSSALSGMFGPQKRKKVRSKANRENCGDFDRLHSNPELSEKAKKQLLQYVIKCRKKTKKKSKKDGETAKERTGTKKKGDSSSSDEDANLRQEMEKVGLIKPKEGVSCSSSSTSSSSTTLSQFALKDGPRIRQLPLCPHCTGQDGSLIGTVALPTPKKMKSPRASATPQKLSTAAALRNGKQDKNIDDVEAKAGGTDKDDKTCAEERDARNLNLDEEKPEDKDGNFTGSLRRVSIDSSIKSKRMCEDVGILKPDGIYFGESLDRSVLRSAIRTAMKSQLVLMVGTTGKVDPARQMPILARLHNRAKVIEINPCPTLLSKCASMAIREPSARVLPKIVERVQSITEQRLLREAMLKRGRVFASAGQLVETQKNSLPRKHSAPIIVRAES